MERLLNTRQKYYLVTINDGVLRGCDTCIKVLSLYETTTQTDIDNEIVKDTPIINIIDNSHRLFQGMIWLLAGLK
jgi:hypothetical protein